jgi:hypothetical protein
MPKYKINIGNQQIEIDTGDDKIKLLPDDQKKIQSIVQKSKSYISLAKGKTLFILKEIYADRVQYINKDAFTLLNLYFRIPFPTDRFTLIDVQRCLSKIYENLCVLEKGFCYDNFTIHQADMKLLSSVGASGYVSGNFFDTLWMQVFTPDFHEFKGTKSIDSPIYLNLKDYLVAPNKNVTKLLIHEASHKFTRTIDNSYISTSLADVMNTKNFNSTMRIDFPNENADKFPIEEEMIITKLSQSSTAGIAKKSWKDLTPLEALNNADSYAGFIVDLASSSSIVQFNIQISVSNTMISKYFNAYE